MLKVITSACVHQYDNSIAHLTCLHAQEVSFEMLIEQLNNSSLFESRALACSSGALKLP